MRSQDYNLKKNRMHMKNIQEALNVNHRLWFIQLWTSKLKFSVIVVQGK